MKYELETMNKHIDNFTFTTVKEKGRWSEYENKWNINYSTILTILIQQVGRLCDNYASDLFIDWTSVENSLFFHDYENKRLLFGIRQNGVDGNTFTLSRLNNQNVYGSNQYRDIYMLDIFVEDNYLNMELSKLNI